MDYLETIIDDRDATAGTPEHNFITEHGLCIFFEKDRKKWMIYTGASVPF
ncbi:MAG: hypothetical protein PHX94_01395 [Bacteroidales bacterium]|jgi:hypothetical protein|nr:hypothetical protein [Bacteroidales bacterium]